MTATPASEAEIWPGPMEGVSQCGFADTVNALRLVDRWMTPFFRISSSLPKRSALQEFMAPFAAGKVPVTVQLMGTSLEKLAAAAREFLELGAAGININFGCPSRRVVNAGAGGGALQTPGILPRIAEAVKNAAGSAEVSVKLRCGFCDPAELDKLLPPLLKCGAAAKFFLHYRTVTELYQPLPPAVRAARFRRAAELLDGAPLIVNGDLADPDEIAAVIKATNAAGAMAARGWMRDPWLLCRCRRAAAPDPETGRRRFFSEFQSRGPTPGQEVELARLLWGDRHPETLAAARRFSAGHQQ